MNKELPTFRIEGKDLALAVLVFVLAFTARLAYLYSYSRSPYWDALVMDPANHWAMAIDVASGRGLGRYAYFRAPLYLWFLGAIVKIFGPSLWAARIAQAAMGSATASLTFILARRLLSDRPFAALAGLISALFWGAVYFDGELLITPLAAFLNIAGLTLIVLAEGGGQDARSLKRTMALWAMAGAALGLASIARPNALVFSAMVPLVLAARAFAERRRNKEPGGGPRAGRIVIGAALFTVFMLAPAVFVSGRNLAAAGDFVPISSQGGINFWMGNNAESDGRTVVVPYPRRSLPLGYVDSWSDHPWLGEDVWLSSAFGAERALKRRPKESEISSYWFAESFRWMADNPGAALKGMACKTLYYVQGREVSNNRDLAHHRSIFAALKVLGLFPYGALSALALAGAALVLADPAERRRWFWPLLFLGAYSLTVIAFFVTSRYRMPVLPINACLAACVAKRAFSAARGEEGARDLGGLARIAATIVFFAAIVNMPWPKWNDRPLRSAMQYNLGIALHEKGRHGAALEAFDRALSIKDFYPECLLWRGLTLEELGDLEGAESSFRRSLAQAPESAMSHYELRSVLLMRAKRSRDGAAREALAREALAHWRKAHELAPGIYPKPLELNFD